MDKQTPGQPETITLPHRWR